MQSDKSSHTNFVRALILLRENPSSKSCLAFARIAGWNFSFSESPLMAVSCWNAYLPSCQRVNYDAFEDKGETPDHLTKSQMQEIQMLEGVTTDPHADGFQPFYTWSLSHPTQSRVYIERVRSLDEAKKAYFSKYVKTTNKIEPQRYWGD